MGVEEGCVINPLKKKFVSRIVVSFFYPLKVHTPLSKSMGTPLIAYYGKIVQFPVPLPLPLSLGIYTPSIDCSFYRSNLVKILI